MRFEVLLPDIDVSYDSNNNNGLNGGYYYGWLPYRGDADMYAIEYLPRGYVVNKFKILKTYLSEQSCQSSIGRTTLL